MALNASKVVTAQIPEDSIVDLPLIDHLVTASEDPAREEVEEVLKVASRMEGLSIGEAALLLNATDEGDRALIYDMARRVKDHIFGKRVVLFAPLYLSSYCTNGCLYCGFKNSNDELDRKALAIEEVVKEAMVLESLGFKRVLLVTGEDKRWDLDYIVDCVEAIYDGTGIRIVHVNAPPMSVDEFRRLKSAGVGVYQSFQETYHRETYALMHPNGIKRDYDFRIETMDRALEAGFGDVGIGALLGLHDFRFDVLATIAHSHHLRDKFKTEAHTVSVPRLRPAEGWGLSEVPAMVSDEEMKLITAVYRLSLPSAGVVISTREPEELRTELLHIGASQYSAGSKTDPGGYGEGEEEKSLQQFSTDDERNLDEVMDSIAREGFMPSLCTSCYRRGRIGEDFTETTLAGDMHKFCQANSVLTLKEYILDLDPEGGREDIARALEEGIQEIEDPAMKRGVEKKLKALEEGERDEYF